MASERLLNGGDAPDRPIAVVGFMGAGKSSVGRLVARALGRPFIDTDASVVAALGRSIPSVFADGEEALMREAEATAVAEAVAHRPPAVISLGGGALERDDTRALLVAECVVVYLEMTWPDLVSALPRLAKGRPLLEGRDEAAIYALFEERRRHYEQAHVTVARHWDSRATSEDVLEALASLR